MKTSIKIQWTDDYSRFDLHPLNRPERARPDLIRSMRENGFIGSEAITVVPNGGTRLLIREGHHRFLAARELKERLAYKVVDPELDFLRMERTKKPYSCKDWVHTWYSGGHADYGVLLQFHEDSRLPLSICAGLVAGNTSNSGANINRVKCGKFKATSDMSHAYAVASVTDACAILGFNFARKTNFVKAVSLVLVVPEVSREALLKKLRKYPGVMHASASVDEYLVLLERVYNHNAKPGATLSIRYPAIDLAKKRKLSGKGANARKP